MALNSGRQRKTGWKLTGSHALVLGVSGLVAACIPQTQAAEAPRQPAPPPARAIATRPYVPPVKNAPLVTQPVIAPAVSAANLALDSRIQSLGRAFGGDVGIAVRDVQTGWTTSYNGTRFFPQQSVSKFWVALTALDRADRGEISLSAPVTMHRSDLTLFNQPIAAQIKEGSGYTTTLGDLMFRAMTQSDNTANDFLLWRGAGGPDAVRAFLRNKAISGIRFGPGERVMQSQIAGMEWKPSFAIGQGFYAARSAVPMERRRAALERYLADPVDGATPVGLVDGLTRLQKGQLLSPAATQRILTAMSSTRTGPQRLKGGLAPGWKLAHKTGTGQILGGTSTGYNDIGIVTAPDGRAYAVAVMIGRTTRPIPERMQLMQNVVRATIDFTRNMQDYTPGTR